MSRIGKKIINVPAGVEVVVKDNELAVNGQKGNLVVKLPKHASVTFDAAAKTLSVNVENAEDGKQSAIWGLTRQLIANAVDGVQKPFIKALEFVGVGYRVSTNGKNVHMEVGFSHPIEFPLPAGIEASVDKQILTLSGIDKQMVGEIAAQIRRIRPPEPYKGKGIKYVDEIIRRKAGKAAAK
jgi:large subunit ribosomal protein L6